MADNDKLVKPSSKEFSPADKTHEAVELFVDGLLENPDEILKTKGNSHDYKVYRELLRDDQVKSVWQQRRLAVTSRPLIVTPASESTQDQAIADALKEDLEAVSFDAATDKMLYGLFYGYGVSEIMWGYDRGRVVFDAIKVRRQWRFRYGQDTSLHLITEDQQTKKMPDRKFWTFSAGAESSDNPYGIGLAHHLYWPVFFKRNDIKFWLIFLEKFGSPTALAKLPAAMMDNAAEKAKVLAALRALTTDSAVLLPEGAELELIEASRSGTADYANMHDKMNAAISKVVLSQTMTTDDGSSMSQAKVHMDVRDEVVDSDARLICESFTSGPVAWWTALNFPGATPPKVSRKIEEDEDINDRAERDKKIYDLGYEPTEEYIQETYGDGWQKREAAAAVDPTFMPEFAEAARITRERISQRTDQAAIVAAAKELGQSYQEVLGDEVQSILAALEDSGDLLTFRERLNAILAEIPSEAAVSKIQNSGFATRLAGMFRGEKGA